tara:strand:+ start:320 stop:505 length:186 start_codon:yes stop_codon:yes gene_type:complete
MNPEELKAKLADIDGAINHIFGYINTIERWRHMQFNKPETPEDGGELADKDGEASAKETND